ncbi:MAG: hypothetical protein H9W82_12485 [Lactobacillus sp.]|nr:hypothetical protein [Lactobacillus sp.]
MNEERISEIEARLAYYFGTPRIKPIKAPTTLEEWKEIEELQQELEQLTKSVKLLSADNYFLTVSKLAKNQIALINNEGGELEVDKRKGLFVRVSVGLENGIQIPDNYTGFMDAVQMTVGSLMDCGARIVTAEQIYRTMNGLDTGKPVTPQAVGAVSRAMGQMRNMWVTIDRTAEINAYRKLTNKLSIIDRVAILPYNKTRTVKNNAGRELTAYVLDELPPLYRYSKDRGEIRKLPIELIKISNLRSSSQNIAIKFYLLQQIESMRPNNKGIHRDNTIKLNTLFEALKYDIDLSASTSRVIKSRYIAQIRTILEDFKSKNYISGYKENIGPKTALESITIFLEGK